MTLTVKGELKVQGYSGATLDWKGSLAFDGGSYVLQDFSSLNLTSVTVREVSATGKTYDTHGRAGASYLTPSGFVTIYIDF